MKESAKEQTILIVEDDTELARWICSYLDSRGYRCTATASGQHASALIGSLDPDLVILDGMLPDVDGLDVCKTARARCYLKPIIMLTSRDEEVDEVLGLEAGADDYLTKPVRARALLARIQKLLKHNLSAANVTTPSVESMQRMPPEVLEFGDMIIDSNQRLVTRGDTEVALSTHEFDVLWFLAMRAGQIVDRQALVQGLRGFDFNGFDRSIDLRVSRLRKKIEVDPSEPRRIKTIWGKGYLFAK